MIAEQAPPPEPAVSPQNGKAPGNPQVQVTLDLPEGARVRVTVEVLPPGGEGRAVEEGLAGEAGRAEYLSEPGPPGGGPVSISVPLPAPIAMVAIPQPASLPAPPAEAETLVGRLESRLAAGQLSLGVTLFGLSLAVYLITRLIGLVNFPIYFFTDEAVQTVLAADLVRDNFHGYDHTFLPTYFKNGSQYNLSASVYAQVAPYLLFGKSVFVTRATSVLAGLLAAACLGLILREIFKIPYWWAGTLLLSIAPAWFLHSRTAFETVLFTSFYTGMLYCYLLYRTRSPKALYPAVGLGALAFYTYSPGQVVVGVTALLLLLSDARYHWQRRDVVLRALGLAVLLALPYLRFRLSHPEAFTDHLKNLDSYWVQPLPLQEKLSRFASEYLYGLSPGYWFVPNEQDLVRHLMKGYGHLLRWTLPFAILGLVLAIRDFRSPAYRAVLVALLAAPAGAAIARIGITRALVFVIPATLLITLGLSRVLVWIEKFQLPRPALSYAVFAALALVNIFMLRDALVNGPTWYQDYGLGGMQYGARQLFGAIRETLQESPGAKVIVSPTWSNGTDVVARFFLPDPMPVEMGSVQGFMNEHLPLGANTLFVMTPDEYNAALSSGKFKDIQVEKSLPYPNGQPGFYFARMSYADNIDQTLAAEREARRELLSGQITWQGQTVQVKYPHLDIGEIPNAFDGDRDTLLRTLEANPAVFVLDFPQPVQVKGLYLKFGATEADVLVRLYPPGQGQPREFQAQLKGDVDKPDGEIDFGETIQAQRIRLELKDTRQGEPGHVHLWEVELK